MMTAASIARPIRTACAATRERSALALVIVITLALELVLVERKYAIIGGGFGQSQPLSGGASLLLFALALLACHGMMIILIFLAVRGLHRRLGAVALFPLNFIVLVTGAMLAALAAKYEVLSYFSDAISFQLIRNLGGGSLFDALLFVLSDGALMIAGVTVGLAVYIFIVRRFAKLLAVSGEGAGLRIPPRKMALAALALVAMILAGNARPDVRSALARFNSYYLFNSALDEITDFDRDGFGLFSQPPDLHPFDASRYPFALDVPGNGIDEDGIGGDFRLAPSTIAGGTTAT
ncbi:MAG: putative sulfatase, partial [Alphaproteobacteria bacterium]|nr:putative sulfatase [Alphaproteobacteria bacterium]